MIVIAYQRDISSIWIDAISTVHNGVSCVRYCRASGFSGMEWWAEMVEC